MKKNWLSQSGFVVPRVLVASIFSAVSIGLILVSLASSGGSAFAQQGKGQKAVAFQSVASYHNDVSRPLRELALLPAPRRAADRGDNENPKVPNHHRDAIDQVVQRSFGKLLSASGGVISPKTPSPTLNFAGIPYPGVGCNCHPPDTNGAIGKTQYVQIVNEGYQVFNKTNGESVLGPVSISSIWSGFGGVCETSGAGDPIVLYDHLADRWVISQFAGSGNPTDECVAVSTTSDATGTYNRYGFHLGTNFFDYPKLGVWPDAYYMSMNVFDSASNYLGPQPFALNRAAMLNGSAASFVSPVSPLGGTVDPILPADLDGATLPPNGAPETFVQFPGSGTYNVYHFHVDFATPANSTWTTFAAPPAAGFTTLCGATRACVPEPGVNSSSDYLDGIGDRLMFRLAYRNFGDHESSVGTYNVSSGGVAGVRWFELRNVTAGPVTVFQESTYQPDATWRWMGSVAMDGAGNMAIGYSVSSSSVFPGIRYNARLAGDPVNTLPQGEAVLINGTGSQTGSGNRWGDYSAMTVDPVDDRTFWYTTEYYTTTGVSWQTRIGSFKLADTANPVADASSVTADNCNSNGIIDPNETVAVNLTIKNVGTHPTTNLVATLQATGGVTNPSGPQTYGAIPAGGGTVTKSFTFTAGSVTCGSTIVVTLQLQDGATNFGVITYNFQVGTPTGLVTTSYSSGNTAVPIPDLGSADIPIVINDTGTVNDINVNVRLNHTFDSDLVMTLIGPDNTTVALVTNEGGSGDNFGTGNNDCSGTPTTLDDSAPTAISAGAAPFAGSFKPESPLSAFNGKTLAGTWRLHIADTAAQDTGTVGCVTLQITHQGYLCCGQSGTPAITAGAAALVAENFSPANNAPDPGETVTVNLPLTNTGTGNTTNLVATLQPTGGVTNPSGPQTYGVVAAGGPAVARPFTFTATGNCGDNIILTLALQDGATNLGTVTFTMRLGTMNTFSNIGSIAIPASGTSGSAAPYPSNIVVSGMSGTISKITVTFVGMTHTFPDDVDILLVSPNGTKMIILSDAGGSNAWSNATITLDDNAPAPLSDAGNNGSGTYKPGNFGTVQDAFASPAPTGPYLSPAPGGTATFASAFGGQNPNGTWSLYIVDDANGDAGSFSGGWQLSVITTVPNCVPTQAPVITDGPPPSPVVVGSPYSFTSTATGNPPPTFSLTGTLPPGLTLSSTGVLSGTATSGGTGTFPNITVTASNGIPPDATQTFSLTTATRAANYIASFGLTGNNAALTFDYDGDGIANLMEYALGLDPTVAGLTGLPVVILKDYGGTKYLSMTFNRSSLATDLTYIAQSSADLVNWTDLASSVGGATTSGEGFVTEAGTAPTFTVEVRDTTAYDPLNPPQHRFMRLKITSP